MIVGVWFLLQNCGFKPITVTRHCKYQCYWHFWSKNHSPMGGRSVFFFWHPDWSGISPFYQSWDWMIQVINLLCRKWLKSTQIIQMWRCKCASTCGWPWTRWSPSACCWRVEGLKLFYTEIRFLPIWWPHGANTFNHQLFNHEDLGKGIHYPILASCLTEMNNFITQALYTHIYMFSFTTQYHNAKQNQQSNLVITIIVRKKTTL